MEPIRLSSLVQDKFKTNNVLIDDFLKGGIEKDIITTIYGPSGSGKTNICQLLLSSCVKQNKKAIYIDTEGGLSLERLKQLAGADYLNILDNTYLFKPTSFTMQDNVFTNIFEMINKIKDEIGIIIIDSIVYLYRLEIAKSKNVVGANQALAKQIGILSEIARNLNIPVIVTNQVYADFERKDMVNMVGGDILKYTSKSLLELEVMEPHSDHSHLPRIRKILIKKNRFLKEGAKTYFEIVDEGIKDINKELLSFYMDEFNNINNFSRSSRF